MCVYIYIYTHTHINAYTQHYYQHVIIITMLMMIIIMLNDDRVALADYYDDNCYYHLSINITHINTHGSNTNHVLA